MAKIDLRQTEDPEWARRLVDLVTPLVTPAHDGLLFASDQSLAIRSVPMNDPLPEPPAGFSRVLTYLSGAEAGRAFLAEVTQAADIDERLHGICAPIAAAIAPDHDGLGAHTTLARSGGRVVWVRRTRGSIIEDIVTGPLPVAGPEGRVHTPHPSLTTIPLLALIQVLREMSDEDVVGPARTASFVIDDPNFHAPSYGYFDMGEAASYLGERNLHLSIATVPIDSWAVRGSVIRLVNSSPALSVSVHGNRHLKREMAADVDAAGSARFGAEASRRVDRLRRRGLEVDPVIIPPHGACSEAMQQGLAGQGYLAVCYTGPVDSSADRLLAVNLYPADTHLRGGLPGLHRIKFVTTESHLRIRSFLGHPVILYGHHEDFVDGLGVLADCAASLARCGDYRWTSLHEVVLSNYAFVRRRAVAQVTAWSSVIDIQAPAGVRTVSVRWPSGQRSDHATTGSQVRLVDPGLRPAGDVPVGRDRQLPEALARRVATEARDRLMPLRARVAAARQDRRRKKTSASV